MDWAIGKELLVDLISYASIVSAAIFGMIGLFTDYKKDGKTTRWGHLAAGGIGLSAMLAMTSAVLQKQIASEERAAGEARAREQQAREMAQFDTQIGQLLRLNTRMAGVNRTNQALVSDMTRSLTAQDLLLTNARRSMLLTASVGAQERQNTGRVLRSMWEESRRVTGDSISVVMSITCSIEIGREFPRLLEHDASAQLRVARLAVVDRPGVPANRFGIGPELVGDDVALFHAVDHRLTVSRATISGSDLIFQISRFGPFNAETWQGFDRPENWEGVALEVFVSGFQPGAIDSAQAAQRWQIGSRTELPHNFVASPQLREWGFVVLPCDVGMSVEVNGRAVATLPAAMVQVTYDDLGRSGFLIAKSPISTSLRDLFPRFAGQ